MLVPLTENDFTFVSSLMDDPVDHEKICANIFSYPLSKSQYINYFIESAVLDKGRLCYKFIHNGESAGMASFTKIDGSNDYGHIGLVTTNPAIRGAGLGHIMLNELLRKGFDELSFNRIDLFVLESNSKAYDFYTTKIGFKDEGLSRDILKEGTKYLSWYTLSILKYEWKTSRVSRGSDQLE